MASKLALLGGSPTRERFLPFSLPTIEQEETEAVLDVLSSGWLTTGPRVADFEAEFARYIGAKYAIAVNSGTAALHLALDAVGLKPGDEVIVPTFTFAATAEVVLYFQARPVLVDIEPKTLNIDPKQVEAAIKPRTRAIISVDIAGQPADYDALKGLAQRHGLALIDDAAHALPTRYRGQIVGTIADLTAFSFYATKPITTGEGGMLTTNEERYAQRAAMMRLHGISHDAWKRYTAEGSWSYEIIAPGYKYNLTDIAAAIGLQQLRKCEALYQRRRAIAEAYHLAFREVPAVEPPFVSEQVQHAWHLYLLRLNLERLRCDRAEFIEALRAENIGTSVHFIPLHLHPFYRQTYGYRPEHFPNAWQAYQCLISLPIYPRMSDDDVQDVIAAVKKVAAHYQR